MDMMAWTTRPHMPNQIMNVSKELTHVKEEEEEEILSTISWCVVSRPCCFLLNRYVLEYLNRHRSFALCRCRSRRFEQNYGDDTCLYEFTPGQSVRMAALWNKYRDEGSQTPQCKDSPIKFKAKGKQRNCAWVKRQKRTAKICKQSAVKSHCPVTCKSLGYCTSDSKKRFRVGKRWKSCKWVKGSSTASRCNRKGVLDTCRATCATTPNKSGPIN